MEGRKVREVGRGFGMLLRSGVVLCTAVLLVWYAEGGELDTAYASSAVSR